MSPMTRESSSASRMVMVPFYLLLLTYSTQGGEFVQGRRAERLRAPAQARILSVCFASTSNVPEVLWRRPNQTPGRRPGSPSIGRCGDRRGSAGYTRQVTRIAPTTCTILLLQGGAKCPPEESSLVVHMIRRARHERRLRRQLACEPSRNADQTRRCRV